MAHYLLVNQPKHGDILQAKSNLAGFSAMDQWPLLVGRLETLGGEMIY